MVRASSFYLITTRTSNFYKVRYSGAAFAARPESSICTCVTWISPTNVAAGCANAHVAIWDIASAITALGTEEPMTDPATAAAEPPPTRSPFDPRPHFLGPTPYFYQRLHQSYILSLVSTSPTHPHFLATTSMDGYTCLTDLRRPHLDAVTAHRIRVASPPLAFSAHALAILTPEDTDSVRALPLRRFFSSTGVGRPAGQVTALATSPCHASLLMGSSDGAVAVTNPLARLVSAKGLGRHGQQIWFKHEWVPAERARAGTSSSGQSPAESQPGPSSPGDVQMGGDFEEGRSETQHSDGPGDAEHATGTEAVDPNSKPELRAGTSRITEGYKLQWHSFLRGVRTEEPGVEPPATPRQPKGKARSNDDADLDDGGGEGTPDDRAQDEPGQKYLNYQTLYEEEAAVTCVAWCPAVECGGWAAAGMGSGLVRVEDIAI